MNDFYEIKRFATRGYCYLNITLHEAGEYTSGADSDNFMELEPEETTPFDRQTKNEGGD